jgi:DNA-binding transcriptional ArsR family regulator
MISEEEKIADEVLKFFKSLADANRLKILGLLAQEDLSVEQLAVMLNLRPSTVSHHLSKLSEAGLVSAKAMSYYNIYQFENKTLEAMAQHLLSKENLSAIAVDVDLDAYDRKVVSYYSLPDGLLKTIPAQRKKLEAILGYISQDFELGTRYNERQVNEILEKYHPDTSNIAPGADRRRDFSQVIRWERILAQRRII